MSDSTDVSEGRILSFTDHLQELRVRIIICLVFFVITFLASFFVAPKVVTFLMKPLTSLPRDQNHSVLTIFLGNDGSLDRWAVVPPAESPDIPSDTVSTQTLLSALARDSFRISLEGVDQPIEIGPKTQTHLNYLTPLEPFYLWLQGALLLSAVLTIPMLVYQFWLFVSPGLLKSERGSVGPLLVGSIILFPMGAGFAYGIMHVTLKVLLSFGDSIPFLEPNLVASSYLSFILIMMIMFGLVFEFPLILLLLAGLGIVNADKLAGQRKIAVVLMAIVAAVATPSPDPFSMIVMLVPLLALYEGSIFAIRYLEKRRAAANKAVAPL